MIKVGQFMSSRLDVLPPEITNELEGLQDEVPAVPFAAIRALAEAELGMPLERAFAWSTRRRSPRHPSARRTGRGSSARRRRRHRARRGRREGAAARHRRDRRRRPGRRCAGSAGWLSRVRLVSDRVDRARARRGVRAHEPRGDRLPARGGERRAVRRATSQATTGRRARGRLGAHDPARAHARGRDGDQDHRLRRAACGGHRPGGGGDRCSRRSCSTSCSRTASSTPTRIRATSSSRPSPTAQRPVAARGS